MTWLSLYKIKLISLTFIKIYCKFQFALNSFICFQIIDIYERSCSHDYIWIFLFRIQGMRVQGDPLAPIKHLCLSEPSKDRDLDNQTLQKIADQVSKCYMGLLMRKPDFCICENKDADQLRGNRGADQRLCFRYTDSTIPLLP